MKKLIAMLLLLSLVGSASALERADWLSPDQYYYQQLSAAHKAAWEHDIANVLKRKDLATKYQNVLNDNHVHALQFGEDLIK